MYSPRQRTIPVWYFLLNSAGLSESNESFETIRHCRSINLHNVGMWYAPQIVNHIEVLLKNNIHLKPLAIKYDELNLLGYWLLVIVSSRLVFPNIRRLIFRYNSVLLLFFPHYFFFLSLFWPDTVLETNCVCPNYVSYTFRLYISGGQKFKSIFRKHGTAFQMRFSRFFFFFFRLFPSFRHYTTVSHRDIIKRTLRVSWSRRATRTEYSNSAAAAAVVWCDERITSQINQFN